APGQGGQREQRNRKETRHREKYRGPGTGGQSGWRRRREGRRLQPMLSLARRALSGLGVVLGVVTLMFALLRLAPGDPARLLVGPAGSPAAIGAPASPPAGRSARCSARRGRRRWGWSGPRSCSAI